VIRQVNICSFSGTVCSIPHPTMMSCHISSGTKAEMDPLYLEKSPLRSAPDLEKPLPPTPLRIKKVTLPSTHESRAHYIHSSSFKEVLELSIRSVHRGPIDRTKGSFNSACNSA
jgi:hypothetical protein